MIFAVIFVFSLTGKASLFFHLKNEAKLVIFHVEIFCYFLRRGVDPTLLSHFENSPRVTWKWNFLINHFNRASFFTKTTTLFFRQASY